MTYNYEALGPEEFQRLAQALVVLDNPNAQLLPVGQPDGGRDAVSNLARNGQSTPEVVYQVKFARDPSSRDERQALEDFVKLESDKVRRLIERGLKRYVLITNVRGTSHLDTGSIDRLNSLLSSELGVESTCWWRDDVDGRLRSNSDIVWSFPSIARGTDVLSLIASSKNEQSERRSRAVKALVTKQFGADHEVKFKEIDLRFSISSIYVDTPLSVLDRESRAQPFIGHMMMPDRAPALRYLLAVNRATDHCRVLIEGAPGQGKSTVTQFLCQVNRAAFLNANLLDSLPSMWTPSSIRIPIRADLRDYATWLQGKSPFGSNRGEPHGCGESLDAFIAALIANESGGFAFDVNDLHASFADTRLLLVLDGFDEVADPVTRVSMAERIGECLSRLETTCLSVQAIVTSRPSALITTPVFGEKSWVTFELQDLTTDLALEYARKWATIKRLDESDTLDLISTLTDKLEERHVSELARNPMQLAILSTLINIQTDSLPSKRTFLYADYVRIFFDRESQKSSTVKRYRSLLLEIHEYLAFRMHCESEYEDRNQDRRPGTLTIDEMQQCIRDFLSRRGLELDMLDGLFTAVQERVVALVQNVQGTYEFQVQPLREFFAAQYLYKSANTRPGAREGSRPDIYMSLVPNSYWANVVRFYAGCYNSGELSSLIDDTLAVYEREGYDGTAFLFRALTNFMRDYVFEDHPRLIRRCIDVFFENTPHDILLSVGLSERDAQDSFLPVACGAEQFVAKLIERADYSDLERTMALARMLRQSATWLERRAFFELARRNRESSDAINLLDHLGLIEQGSISFLQELVEEYGQEILRYMYHEERWEVFNCPDGHSKLLELMLEYEDALLFDYESSQDLFEALATLLSPYLIRTYHLHGGAGTLSELRQQFFGHMGSGSVAAQMPLAVRLPIAGSLEVAYRRVEQHISQDVAQAVLAWGDGLSEIVDLYGMRPAVALACARWAIEAVELAVEPSRVEGPIRFWMEAYINRANQTWWEEPKSGLSELEVATAYAMMSVPIFTGRMLERFAIVLEKAGSKEGERIRGLLRVMPHQADHALLQGALISALNYPVAFTLILESVETDDIGKIIDKVIAALPDDACQIVIPIFDVAFSCAVEGLIVWDVVIAVGKLARQSGLASMQHASWRGGQPIEPSLADAILNDTSLYPISLVSLAERSRSVQLAGRAEKIDHVAKSKLWFASV